MIKVTGYIDGTPYTENIIDKNGKQDCPVCVQVGKKQHKDKPLSVNLQNQAFKCHRCTWVGYFGEKNEANKMDQKQYKTPIITNQTELSLEHLQIFSKRLISQSVLKRNKVRTVLSPKTGSKEFFAFTFFEQDKPVKIKFKNGKKADEKKIYQQGGCKPWIYKYNDLIGQSEVMVCEGEEEALIWEVAGFNHACSVDAGAPNVNDKNVDAKLQCITNCFDVFEEAEIVYIAVDNDPNGKRLSDELIKRFGAEKCKTIDFEPCKDANEYALKFGTDKLIELKDNAKQVPVAGVHTVDDFLDTILHNYTFGQPKGTTTYFCDIDKHWKWRLSEVNLWTGYNNEGKSQLLKQLMIAKSLGDGWKHAIFSPEEYPADEWFTDLIESYVGKSADKDNAKYNNYMTKAELMEGVSFLREHFINIYPSEDHSIEELLKLFSYTVRKYGIKTVTIDPYNQVQHVLKPGQREDLYISWFMTQLKRFAINHDISLNLIAHQNTPKVTEGQNYPIPNIYNVKGGGTFGDKVDNLCAVWRENRNTDISDTSVKFISQKIKKQKLTGIPGTAKLDFDRNSNRYLTDLGVSPLKKLLDDKHFKSNKQTSIHDNIGSFYEKEKEYAEVEDDFLKQRNDEPF